MIQEKDFSNLRIINCGAIDIQIVDRHQYTLPLWAQHSLNNNQAYTLVSIDYHPDTNPAFYQKVVYEMAIKNIDQHRINDLIQRRIDAIDRENLNCIISCTDQLNNDEHINTAMSLSYLNDYHMINCMEKHNYNKGKHYLVDDKHFGSLEDDMFELIGFKLPATPFILDIDLDYFLAKENFSITHDKYMNYLINNASLITIARSVKYFNYLKKDDFTINECEELCVELIKKYIRFNNC